MCEQHSTKNMEPERSAAMTINASNMNHGWHQMVNDTVHYYQTPNDVAAIVEQLSSYNRILQEQIAMEEDEIRQNYKSNEVKRCESNLRASANECFPKRIEEKCERNDDALNNNWIRPKKCMPTSYFIRRAKMKKR